jgi:hypothetical protein
MKNKERIAILEAEISRLKVANRNNIYRLEAVESHLAEQHRGANFSKLNSSGIPNTCDPFKPKAPECVADNGAPNEGHLREHIDNFFNPKADNAIKSFEAKIMQEFGDIKSGEAKQVNREDIANGMVNIMVDVINKAIEPIKPDFIPDWKDAPEDAVCVAMEKSGKWFWWKKTPIAGIATNYGWNTPERKGGLSSFNVNAGTCTNAHLLPPDYWKGTLMMRPDAVKDYTHLLPGGYEFCEQGEHEKFVKAELFGLECEQPVGFITDYNIFIGKYLPIRKSSPDYSHLLPEGYEFCSEEDAEKWVKVEYKVGWPLGTIVNTLDKADMDVIMRPKIKPYYRPIRPIQYKVTTHEITTAVPDPYMPDWSQAPEGAVAHAWDEDERSFWIYIDYHSGKHRFELNHLAHTLPPDLDWKQSLRVKPSK